MQTDNPRISSPSIFAVAAKTNSKLFHVGPIEKSANGRHKRRQIAPDRLPQNAIIHAFITVTQQIAEIRDFAPSDVRCSRLQVCRNVTARLRNDLQITNNGVVHKGARRKDLECRPARKSSIFAIAVAISDNLSRALRLAIKRFGSRPPRCWPGSRGADYREELCRFRSPRYLRCRASYPTGL